MGGGGQTKTQQVPTTTKAQQQFGNQFYPWASSYIGKGETPYGGQLTAAIPTTMSEALAKIGSYGSQPPQMLTNAQNTINELSQTPGYQSGMNPNDWAKAYENRAWGQYNQNVAPQISNNYLGSSFWNTRRNTDLNQAAQSTGQDIALQAQNVLMNRSDAEQQAYQNAQQMRFGAALQAPQMSIAPQQLAIGAGQQQMGLEQAALSAKYQEFMRTLPERNQMVLAALGQSQQPTMNTIATPQPNYLNDIMGGGMNAALIYALMRA